MSWANQYKKGNQFGVDPSELLVFPPGSDVGLCAHCLLDKRFNELLILDALKIQLTGRMDQEAEHLPRKQETLSSIPSVVKTNKQAYRGHSLFTVTYCHTLDMKCPSKVLVLKAWSPACDNTGRWWSLVEGSEVMGACPQCISRGHPASCSFLFYFLSASWQP
jgi:hypothetical protein